MVATKLVPVVSIVHLVVQRLIDIHKPRPHVGRRKNLPTSEGSSMTRSTSVALCGSYGVSMVPLTQSLLWSTTQASCMLHDGERATKPYRRWQPPRITSTTGLQLDHLVPLDAISQCNRTRITHSQSDAITMCTSELEALLALPKHGH